jgi:glycosyltransferase involved in cell wall biosynthesis
LSRTSSRPSAEKRDDPGLLGTSSGLSSKAVPRREAASLDVLIVSQPVSAGVAVCVRQLTEAAVSSGHRVTVACPGREYGPLAGWVEEAGARHETVNMTRRPALRDVRDLLTIRRLSAGRDVVHVHSSKAGVLGRVAVASLGRYRPMVVFTPHYWSWLVGGLLSGLYRLIERVLAHASDAIVAVSGQEAEDGRPVLGSAGARVRVIPNGVDLDRFTPEGPSAPRHSSSPLIVLVGRLCRQKGQDVAIRALAALSDGTARLRLVGGESEHGQRHRLQMLADSLGVADRIEWRGETTDVAPDLRSADLVIAPSRWEGMSLVFLEAMACGAPMVVTDVSGSDVVDGAGVIVPKEDSTALAQAIDGLLKDDERRRSLGRRAAQLSHSHDLKTTLHQNIALWETLSRSKPVS